MAKDPDDRWQSAADLKRELGWIREEQGVFSADRVAAPSRSLMRRRTVLIGATVVLAALTVVLVRWLRHTTDAQLPARVSIHLPDSTIVASAPGAQISPDGTRVAFLVEADQPIFLRSLNAQSAESIKGTEQADSLFWSPDSQNLGFITRTAVKKLTVADGTVETLCEACKPGSGGTWSRNGLIVFPSQDGTLLGIATAGGEPRTITSLDRSKGEIAHIAPHFLPDGERFLYVIRNADPRRSGLYVGEVRSQSGRLLLQGEHPAIYAAPGYLVFARAGSIVAQPFDVKRLELTGDVVPLVTAAEYWPVPVHGGGEANWFGQWPSFSTSEAGTLTYAISEHPELQFQWVSRNGQQLQSVGEPGAYMTFDLAPDGTRVVLSRGEGALASLWMLDAVRGVSSRLTFGASSSYYDPRWASGSQWVAANRPTPPPPAIFKILPDGREAGIVSASGGDVCVLDDVSDDGSVLLCRRRGARELVAIPLANPRQPISVRAARSGYIDQAQFSPDARWIAYNADESGRHEVYVTAFPPTGERWQVSENGGVQPIWRQDGREMCYLGLDGVLKAVAVQSGDRPQFSVPTRLFDTRLGTPSPWIEQYSASADGGRFLILKPEGDKVRNSVGVILNWPALLQARAR